MKKIFFAAIIVTAILTSCGGKNPNNNPKESTHNHENCSGDDHQEAGQVAAPSQESFKVEADSTTTKSEAIDCDHNHDHSHDGHKH